MLLSAPIRAESYEADTSLASGYEVCDRILDGATTDQLSDEQRRGLCEMVREDFRAAEDARQERAERAIRDLRLYHRAVREGEEAIEQEGQRGPFGWSRLQVPLIWWIVQTELPRHGTQPPQITVNAKSPESVPFAQAKQMRLQHYLGRGDWITVYLRLMLSRLVLGDGIAKVAWDVQELIPRMLGVSWFDFFCSEEADHFDEADCLFQRTAYSRRQLRRLFRGADDDIWHGYDDLVRGAGTRSAWDSSYDERRGLAWLGASGSQGQAGREAIPLVEAWYSDGVYVVVGGHDYSTLVRAQTSPLHDEHKHPIRPYAHFCGIADLSGPYSGSIAQVLEDHQVELSTLRNQQVDQITGNLNAGVVYDESQITSPAVVDDFLGRPNGRLGVQGDPRAAIMRLPPGQISGDFPLISDNIRQEAQMTAGITDISSGQTSAEGISNQTATGLSIIASETNKRIQLGLRMDEVGMRQVALRFDWLDRQQGLWINLATEPGFTPREGQQGIDMQGPDFAGVGPEVNGPPGRPNRFEIEVDAGSTQRPDQMEEAQKMLSFAAQVGAMPMVSSLIDWSEWLRKAIAAFGMSDDKLLLPPPGPGGMPMPAGRADQPIESP